MKPLISGHYWKVDISKISCDKFQRLSSNVPYNRCLVERTSFTIDLRNIFNFGNGTAKKGMKLLNMTRLTEIESLLIQPDNMHDNQDGITDCEIELPEVIFIK